MKRVCFVLLGSLIASAVVGQVSVETLLPQMTDLSRLARRPKPSFRTAQASSYDRASVDPKTNWFANADWGKYLRVEQVEGRREYVMADLKGPGAVVRLWSANPFGVLRFYFDGESKPRIQVKTADLLTGKVAPFGDPFGYMVVRGTNLYFPFPYSKSLKITVDDTDNNRALNMYYHVGYREYAPGTMVKTFRWEQLEGLVPLIGKVKTDLLDPAATVSGDKSEPVTANLFGGGQAEILNLSGPKEITELNIALDLGDIKSQSEAEWRVLRSLILDGWFDGEKCVSVPLGDFFGVAPGLSDYESAFVTVKGRELTARFVMPFASSARFRLTNLGTTAVKLTVASRSRPITYDSDTYHFKAQFGGERGMTRPMRDMTFLSTTGEGAWIGSNLSVRNPVDGWWGEGDEKIWVDRETFPSTFGTGTEDYYGYAWSTAEPFMKPYHAEPFSSGPQTQSSLGYSMVQRWHIIDVIPFNEKFKFDLEMWHWSDCLATFLHTAYWYARPGTPGPKAFDSSLLLPTPVGAPEPFPGANEAELFAVESKTGGLTEVQGFGHLSSGKQVWWRDAKPGEKIVFRVPIKVAGKYLVTGNFCHATDYGIHKLTLNGQPVTGNPMDFFSKDLRWAMRELGTFDLPAGTVTLEVEVVGANPAAEPRYMFGLDYLKFDPK